MEVQRQTFPITEAHISDLFDKRKFAAVIELISKLNAAELTKLTDYSCFLVFIIYHETQNHQEAAQWADKLISRKHLNLTPDVLFNFLSLAAVSFLETGHLVRSMHVLKLSLTLRPDKKNQELLEILKDKFFRRTAEKVHWVGAAFILLKLMMDYLEYYAFWRLLLTTFFLLHVMIYVSVPHVLTKAYWEILCLYFQIRSLIYPVPRIQK